MRTPDEMRPGNRYAREAATCRTLRDMIASKSVVVAVCRRCKHEKMLFPADLIERLGADLRVADLWTKLRCSGCRGRGVARVHESSR
jgi:hypothetical protein